MAEITYASSLHLDAQIVLDHAAENLVPSSILVPLILRTKMPTDTINKKAKKKGSLARETVAEGAASTPAAYTETNTALQVVKNVVTTRNSVESLDFDAGDNLASILGEEAAKALAYGMDEDIAALFQLASAGTTAVASLTLADVLANALLVKTNSRGAANGKDGGIIFVGSFQQVDAALVSDPLTSVKTLYANAGTSLGGAFDSVHGEKAPNGYVHKVGGVSFFEGDFITDDATNEFGAVFSKAAIIGMYDDLVRALDQNDVINYRILKGLYHYSDFGIHWQERIAKVRSAL